MKKRLKISPKGWTQYLKRTSNASDVEGAGLVLSSVLSDEDTMRAAFSTPAAFNGRSAYILFGGHWGPRAAVTWKARLQWNRIVVEAVSKKPALIRSVIRADRYEAYLRSRKPGGAATINYFPFFESAAYADDLVEGLIEIVRKASSRAAEPMVSMDHFVLYTASEMELGLLAIWQMACGACNRLDLIDKATPKNWRGRFPDLDRWFQENRPYIIWDNGGSCIRIDQDAKELGRPTPRTSRSIPELKPPWLPGEELKPSALPAAKDRK